jgi:hypothetical protein
MMDPLHIDDALNDFHDTTHDKKPTKFLGREDDDDNDQDYNNDDDDDTDENDDDDLDEIEDDIENDHDDDPENDDDDGTPLRGDDDEVTETQDLDGNVDKKPLNSNGSSVMNRLFTPQFTFTPPSPQAGNVTPGPLRFGHKADFVNHETKSTSLRVPDAPKVSSPKDLPGFFRLPPTYHQSGKSGERFANRMFTKWTSLKARMGTIHKQPKVADSIRPTKLRRVVGDRK